MILYLVRHGQTDWNLENRVQGRSDIPLNGNGIAQAEALAEELSGAPVSAIYSSGLLRARETAERIRRRTGLPPERLVLLPELTEVDFGPWEGMTLDEIRRIYPEEYARWASDYFGELPAGGETKEEILRRIEGALRTIAGDAGPEEDREAVIVAHGGLLLRLLVWLLRDAGEIGGIRMENASIAKVAFDPVRLTGRMVYVNRTPWKK